MRIDCFECSRASKGMRRLISNPAIQKENQRATVT